MSDIQRALRDVFLEAPKGEIEKLCREEGIDPEELAARGRSAVRLALKSHKGTRLPEISHLQFAFLEVLSRGPLRGCELRRALLKERHICRSGPAFYQFMARLEAGKYVHGETVYVEQSSSMNGRERKYTLTQKGIDEVWRTRAFYARNEAI